MNTPPTKKRFKMPPDFFEQIKQRQGTWSYALQRDDYKLLLAQIVVDFEQLEFHMPNILSALLQTPWSDAGGYVYRSLRNPSIRASLMWHLLEVCPQNKDAPEFIDEILKEYGAIRVLRNEYVHGLWFTKIDQPNAYEVYLARFPEHGGWMPGEMLPEPIEKLQVLAERIGRLKVRVSQESGPYLHQLRQQQEAFFRKSAEHRVEREQRRAAKASRPPLPPSEASPQKPEPEKEG